MQRLHSRNGAITTLGLENGGEKGDKNWKATIALLRRSSIFQEGKKFFVDKGGGATGLLNKSREFLCKRERKT